MSSSGGPQASRKEEAEPEHGFIFTPAIHIHVCLFRFHQRTDASSLIIPGLALKAVTVEDSPEAALLISAAPVVVFDVKWSDMSAEIHLRRKIEKPARISIDNGTTTRYDIRAGTVMQSRHSQTRRCNGTEETD